MLKILNREVFSVAEPPLFWTAPATAPGRQGPGAESGSGFDLLGSATAPAPAPGKKGGSRQLWLRLHTVKFFILSS